jgi:hypothetical protein
MVKRSPVKVSTEEASSDLAKGWRDVGGHNHSGEEGIITSCDVESCSLTAIASDVDRI